MRKIKFLKRKYGVCVCLDNSLFKDKSDKVIKLDKILGLVSDNIEKYEGVIFINVNGKSIVDELYKFKIPFELISTSKNLFNREKEEKYKVTFNNEQIKQMIDFLINNDLTFDGKGYMNNDDEFLLNIVINDHDGSYITFHDKIFEESNYKQLINSMFKTH